jgi:uncharacterized protein (DUF1800 family)
MDRKSFLTAKTSTKKPLSIYSTQQTARINSGVAAYLGTWDTPQITHLLKRTMFGSTRADILYFKTKTMSQAVDELCTPLPAPLPPVNHYQGKDDGTGHPIVDPTGILKGQTWVNADYGDGITNSYRELSLKSWWIGQMHNQGRNITEKMTLFWHNHFPTQMAVVGDARFAFINNALLRQNALGNFKQLAKAIVLDPMMLVYLNNFVNSKNAPDENLARELQELFVCGKGPNSQYTENDVKAFAKVLTGIGLNYNVVKSSWDLTYVFNPANHDTSDKSFSAFYNNTIITGQTGVNGINELDSLINMIFAGKPAGQTIPEAAYFISRKLYRWFVYYAIDATVETNVIAPMAQALITANWDITAPLKLLLKSEHFFDSLNSGCQIKGGIDYTLGLLRELGVVMQDPDVTKLYDTWSYVYYFLSNIAQPNGEPPNVAGWPAYYQEPIYYESWINTDTLPKRAQFVQAMVYYNYGLIPAMDVIAFADALSTPGNPNTLVSETLEIVLKIDLSQTNRDFIKSSTLLGGLTNDVYWTQAWDLYKIDITNTVNKNIIKTRLQNMLFYIMSLAEYQLA